MTLLDRIEAATPALALLAAIVRTTGKDQV